MKIIIKFNFYILWRYNIIYFWRWKWKKILGKILKYEIIV